LRGGEEECLNTPLGWCLLARGGSHGGMNFTCLGVPSQLGYIAWILDSKHELTDSKHELNPQWVYSGNWCCLGEPGKRWPLAYCKFECGGWDMSAVTLISSSGPPCQCSLEGVLREKIFPECIGAEAALCPQQICMRQMGCSCE